MHCRSGADRTGEATAVYLIDYMSKSRQAALEQVSWRYLHASLFMPAKRVFVENYGGKEWALKDYNPCNEPFRPHAKDESGCPPIGTKSLSEK